MELTSCIGIGSISMKNRGLLYKYCTEYTVRKISAVFKVCKKLIEWFIVLE